MEGKNGEIKIGTLAVEAEYDETGNREVAIDEMKVNRPGGHGRLRTVFPGPDKKQQSGI